MQVSTTLEASFHGTAVSTRGPATERAGSRQPLQVRAYKKNAGRVKGGYKDTQPNAKKKFCKVDSSGRPSKGYGAYRFTNKYGDINDYSPIYDEYDWTPAGDVYALGTKGLTAWGALLAASLGVSVFLILKTSQLG